MVTAKHTEFTDFVQHFTAEHWTKVDKTKWQVLERSEVPDDVKEEIKQRSHKKTKRHEI